MFNGLGVALITPFKENGDIDYPSLDKSVQYIIDGGVDYLVVLGTTSEAPTLSAKEKLAVLNFVIESANGKVPIVVGIGGNNTAEVIETAKHYPLEQVEGILCVVPFYNKPTQEGLYQHYKAIVTAIDKPFILYNVPSRTGTNMLPSTILRLANEFKNVVAVKEANNVVSDMEDLIKGAPTHFSVLSGDDDLFLSQAAMGMTGVISVIANGFPTEFAALVNAALKGKFDEARKIHFHLLPMLRLIFKEGNPTGIKYAMHKKGLLQNYLRLPLIPSTQSLELEINDAFIEANFN